MNVFIVAVCVNLLTLVNAAQNVDFETILEILKTKPISSGYSNNIEISHPDEVLRILPGFYLEKPKDLSKSLFKNPKPWPDDIYDVLDKEEVERNKTKVNENTEITASGDEYLQEKILKAIEDLKRFRASQKQKSDKTLKESQIDSGNAQKQPVKKLLGRIFQGMHGNTDNEGKQKIREPKIMTASDNNEIIRGLLKNLLSGNLNNQLFQNGVKHVFAKTEEESQSSEELLGNILNDIQNNPLGSQAYLHPSMVLISPTSRDNDDNEMDNNAMEETSDEDYDSTALLTTKTRRKADDTDIGSRNDSSSDKISDSDSDSDSESESYERNPGNPFTVHKNNKYKQNWPYNHFMDGDHMNINPFGPKFGSLGPSGPELFFGRKWWYFNQDDYKPMA